MQTHAVISLMGKWGNAFVQDGDVMIFPLIDCCCSAGGPALNSTQRASAPHRPAAHTPSQMDPLRW